MIIRFVNMVRYFKKQLMNCPIDISLTIALSPRDLRATDLTPLIKYAVTEKHLLAYTFDSIYDKKFRKMPLRKMLRLLGGAMKAFKEQYGYELKYVFFPDTKQDLSRHVKTAQAAGYIVFGSYMWVDEDFHSTRHSKVEKLIKQVASKGGPIIYLDADSNLLQKDIDDVYKMLHAHRLQVVSLDKCI